MTNDLGGMPLTPKMNTFETKIGSDQRLMAMRNPQNGAVVANSECDTRAF
jgi:hypothetical protein